MANWKLEFEQIKLEQLIGRGNFGEVYKGTYVGSDVAVKKLYFVDDDFMQKYIEREMDTLTKLQHPNIVQLMGLCIEANDMFIVTEFVGGGDLRSKLKDKTGVEMSWTLRVKISLDVALAMAYLHSKGLMHRDLKSHNLLVDDNWKIKVCDFGLARKEDGGGDFMTIVGTNEWMAPEVGMGDRYGKSADVFSFGMVLMELITREKPPERKLVKGYAFEREEMEQLIPTDTPKDLWELLCECCAFEAEKRPAFPDIVTSLKAIRNRLEGGGDDDKKSSKKDGKKKEKSGDKKEHKKKKDGKDGKESKKEGKDDKKEHKKKKKVKE